MRYVPAISAVVIRLRTSPATEAPVRVVDLDRDRRTTTINCVMNREPMITYRICQHFRSDRLWFAIRPTSLDPSSLLYEPRIHCRWSRATRYIGSTHIKTAAGTHAKTMSSNRSVKSNGRHAVLTRGPKVRSLPFGHSIEADFRTVLNDWSRTDARRGSWTHSQVPRM
jgi:hypothetical protein